ncbi:hypothetical protein [Streptomyces sp. NPDC058620]|uniref:hypothetical protein n=1 Tax=Streptomyces sp. NPDC058620 TaxID=3346560 RepID=UPI003653E7CC
MPELGRAAGGQFGEREKQALDEGVVIAGWEGSFLPPASAVTRGRSRRANVNTVGCTRGRIREAFKIHLGKNAPSTVI